jgi:predicted negative regulator of RcsB-dependent stress response
LDAKGYTQDARRFWQASADLQGPYSDYANLALAGDALRQGKVQEAEAFLNQIPDGSFAAAHKYEQWGDTRLRAGCLESAMAGYRRCLEINSGLLAPRLKLIRVHQALGAAAEARVQAEKRRYIRSFYDPVANGPRPPLP